MDYPPFDAGALGMLEIVEVYDYYDRPLLFIGRNELGNDYFVMAAKKRRREIEWRLFRIESDEQKRTIMKHPGYDLFKTHNGSLWVVTTSGGTVKSVDKIQFPIASDIKRSETASGNAQMVKFWHLVAPTSEQVNKIRIPYITGKKHFKAAYRMAMIDYEARFVVAAPEWNEGHALTPQRHGRRVFARFSEIDPTSPTQGDGNF